MRTSAFEVQTHAARRDGQKASRANNHSCFDFFFTTQVFILTVKPFSNM